MLRLTDPAGLECTTTETPETCTADDEGQRTCTGPSQVVTCAPDQTPEGPGQTPSVAGTPQQATPPAPSADWGQVAIDLGQVARVNIGNWIVGPLQPGAPLRDLFDSLASRWQHGIDVAKENPVGFVEGVIDKANKAATVASLLGAVSGEFPPPTAFAPVGGGVWAPPPIAVPLEPPALFARKDRSFSSGQGTHTALVTVARKGTVILQKTFQSGNMTELEKALGFPLSSLATHTEARAITQISLGANDWVFIDGEFLLAIAARAI